MGEHFSVDRFFVKGEISILVNGGSPYYRDVNRKRAEEEPLLPSKLDDLDKIFVSRTLFAAGLARVDVRVEPDLGDETRSSGGNVATQLR